MKKLTESDYEHLGRQAGFEWIGEALPTDMLEKTRWRCRVGHEFESRAANVYLGVRNGGRGCPYCSHRWRRAGLDYHKLAKLHDVEWVGQHVPDNTRSATTWRMPSGEIREYSYRTIAARVSKLGHPKQRVEGR